ncbi:uncharacterized protein si:dkey-75a21.2 [Scomber japonicus]|uniref:uncharacterized protein si:dkey-75a21.2 n=1 Tax=Scomber japonicus TaxID=13676 RepID=UPI002304FC25|nr:uncharacterized protein si:dkey-75a21.2 [Scomber japonicus]
MMSTCLYCQQQSGRGEEVTGDQLLLKNLLPAGYVHLVCSYEETAQTQFRAHIKLKLTSQEEAHKWLEDFQTSSGQTWRKAKTYPNTGRYNAYRVDLRCQHNTFPRTDVKKTKNTSCGATMYLVLKRHMCSQSRKSRSGDPHIKDGYLLNVNLKHEHNHRLSSADAVRRRDVSGETIAKLKTLFENGHTPSSALDSIKHELQEREGENYVHAAADRSICPDVQFCYRLYYKLFQRAGSVVTESADCTNENISPEQDTSVEHLEEMIQQFCRSLTDKLKDDPQTFTAPVCTFLNSYDKMNDGSLTTALQCFGKAPRAKSKNLQSSKMMGVQQTAVARRKIAGRPLKCSRKEQHPYSKKQQIRQSSPPSISNCVEETVALTSH